MIIYTQKNIQRIRKYLTKMDWGNEVRFFNSIVADIERNGDQFGFLDVLENYSTVRLRECLSGYIKYSMPYTPVDSKENAHFNNVHAIDSAVANGAVS